MLYQQGTQRIEVIVRKEGGGGTPGANETDTDDIGSQESAKNLRDISLYGTTSQRRIKRIWKTNTTHILAFTKQAFDMGANYWFAGYGMKYGDQAYQESVQRRFEIVKDFSGLASSVGMGALYGSWGGPLGAFVGATLGVATNMLSTGTKYMGREREFDYKTFKENNSIEYQRARASINLTTGRLR